MYKYCLFDLDGTLTDPKEGITKCVQYALQKFGINEPDLHKLEPFIGPPLKDSFMHFYSLSDADAVQAISYFRERFAPTGIFENQIFSGIKEMLEKLSSKGIHLAVASSKPMIFVRKILAHFEIERFFQVVVGSELDGTRVSKEEVVEEALSQLGVNKIAENERKKLCAMIGDRKFDIEGAKAHGLTGIGVTFGYAEEGELEKAGADFIVNSVDELSSLLNGEK